MHFVGFRGISLSPPLYISVRSVKRINPFEYYVVVSSKLNMYFLIFLAMDVKFGKKLLKTSNPKVLSNRDNKCFFFTE